MRLLTAVLILAMTATIAFGKTKIKFATVAPEGSTWMNVMKEFAQAVNDKTTGEVKFRIYPGGVSGDELVVLRKIRVGQLHSAGFTGVGLGEILPEVRILDAPFLFKNYEEVDYVTSKLFDYFAGKFEEIGPAFRCGIPVVLALMPGQNNVIKYIGRSGRLHPAGDQFILVTDDPPIQRGEKVEVQAPVEEPCFGIHHIPFHVAGVHHGFHVGELRG